MSPYFQFIMTPGRLDTGSIDQGEASWRPTGPICPTSIPSTTPNGRVTDADGRITLPDLIPGAPYRISDWSTVNVQDKGYQIRKDFTVKPGETLDLGDILVEKPQTSMRSRSGKSGRRPGESRERSKVGTT